MEYLFISAIIPVYYLLFRIQGRLTRVETKLDIVSGCKIEDKKSE